MRKLDDIIPPSRRREMEPMMSSSPVGREPVRPEQPSRFPYTTIIVIVAVIAVSIAAMFYFSTAKVEVTPNTVSAAVQSSFTANQSSGALPYEIITAQKIASQSVKSNGTKAVSSSASGTITIYNTQSSSQPLLINTRFATASGLVFKTYAAVTVPSGSASKPGTVTARVYADKAGDSYNVGASQLTVVGFTGTPKASQVYGRSTVAMTGGASGTAAGVDATLESQTRTALKSALAPDLEKSLAAQIPVGYLLLSGASATTYEDLTNAASATTGMADVKEQGTITAIVFPNTALAKAIAGSVGGLGYQGEPVTLASTDTITLSTPNGLPAPDAASFSFSLNGTASLIYSIDPARISTAISGKTRSAAQVALTNYPEIKRAVIILRPFWRQAFPQDPSAISVVVVNP